MGWGRAGQLGKQQNKQKATHFFLATARQQECSQPSEVRTKSGPAGKGQLLQPGQHAQGVLLCLPRVVTNEGAKCNEEGAACVQALLAEQHQASIRTAGSHGRTIPPAPLCGNPERKSLVAPWGKAKERVAIPSGQTPGCPLAKPRVRACISARAPDRGSEDLAASTPLLLARQLRFSFPPARRAASAAAPPLGCAPRERKRK